MRQVRQLHSAACVCRVIMTASDKVVASLSQCDCVSHLDSVNVSVTELMCLCQSLSQCDCVSHLDSVNVSVTELV